MTKRYISNELSFPAFFIKYFSLSLYDDFLKLTEKCLYGGKHNKKSAVCMKKIDFKKDFKELYGAPSKKVSVVDVPEMKFLAIDGKGDPNDEEFQNAVKALYNLAFTIKFSLKFAKTGPEYTVPPLEGLWWMPENRPFDAADRKSWLWTVMIAQPDHVTAAHMKEAVKKANEKNPTPVLSKIRLENFKEGLSAQIMHIGPYSKEAESIEKIDRFLDENKYAFRGKHHEIYLSDPRRVAPEKMRTILRHPVKKK